MKENAMARIRSPNYPQIDLQEAVGMVRKIFDKEGTNFAPREVVAQLLGHGSVNGASDRKTSALSAYGFLDRNEDRELRVSDLAMRVLHPENHAEEVEALAEAAMSPNLFREICEKWPETLPSDESLKSYLIRRGFNQNAVGQVIAVFRGAMSLAQVETNGHDSEDETMGNPSEPPEREAIMQAATTAPKPATKPIVFDMETISGQYSFDNADDLAEFIGKLEKIRPLLPNKN